MFVNRTHGVVAATLGVLTLGACTDPESNTDLRPEGPPDVLAVLVMTDAAAQLKETATYCRPNDEKRPSLVGLPDITTTQVCPASLSEQAPEVTSAYPDGWYVRVMFDELLDPTIEELTPVFDDSGTATGAYTASIASAHPAKIECENSTGALVNVDYDGYYSPAGNRVTWPVGPSLVFKPNDAKLIATNTNCQITLGDNILDKDGNPVPTDERGPYKFKVAPIRAILVDPPDDPDGANPIDATQVYFDNFYIQFNTSVFAKGFTPTTQYNGLCNDVNADGLCDDESLVSFQDPAHPMEGPGYCNSTFAPCSTFADCSATGGDTLCGKAFCDTTFTPCNKQSDCTDPTDTFCEPGYTYSYAPFGATEAEFGVGPINPIETDKAYVFQLQPGAMFYDRCGRATTFQPSVDDNTQVHFTTNPFKFNKANIATGETASAVKKLQLQYSNVVDLGDTARQPITTLAPAEFSITPAPFMPNATAGMPPVQITDPTKFLIASPDGNGAIMLRGYYQMDTQYTFTVKAGATVDDFYRKVHDTAAEDRVVTWKTQPAIVVSSISPLDTATVKKSSATSVSNLILTFNQAMVPTSLDANDFTITPAVAGLTFGKGTSSASSTSARDCTDVHNACRLRISGVFPAGAYTFTLKAGATFTDVFGNTYTQAADKVVHFTVVDAPPPVIKCL